MLERFGFHEIDEALYVGLVDAAELSAADLATLAGTTEDAVPALLDPLRSAGLITKLPGQPDRYCAIEPELALAPLLAARSQQLEHARTAARHLGERFRTARPGEDPLDLVEVVVEEQAKAQRLDHLRQLAQDEIRAIDKPPYLGPDEGRLVPVRTGVRVRNLYDQALLDIPAVLQRVLCPLPNREEQARVILQAPFQLRLADDRLAIVYLNGRHTATGAVLVVHPSPLLDGVVSMFETLWRHACPLQPVQPTDPDVDGPSPEETKLLPLMAAGMTDQAAARHLGLSLRTVQRQTRAMMNRLGAQTRFQAGLQAGNRGWL